MGSIHWAMHRNIGFPKYPNMETAKYRPHPEIILQSRKTEILMYYGVVVYPALVSSLHAKATREQKCNINPERE